MSAAFGLSFSCRWKPIERLKLVRLWLHFYLLCDIDRLSDEDGVNVSKRLKEIIEIENIKKADIDSFISLYPLKVYRNFYDYGLYEAFL